MWKISLAAIGFLLGQLLFFFALMTVHDLARAGGFLPMLANEALFLASIRWGTLPCGLAGCLLGYRLGARRDRRISRLPLIRMAPSVAMDSDLFVVPTFSLVAYLLT